MKVIQANITTLHVDAVVNAANPSLMGGGGVDGAIHAVAGPQLVEECRLLGGCAVGDAKITRGYKLPARYVIHTVGPVWHGGQVGEGAELASCYRRCLEIAQENDVRTIAFPAISTGVYAYPLEEATEIAVGTVRAFLEESMNPIAVTFCCFSERDFLVYERQIQKSDQ